jgi:hypothetical protein
VRGRPAEAASDISVFFPGGAPPQGPVTILAGPANGSDLARVARHAALRGAIVQALARLRAIRLPGMS